MSEVEVGEESFPPFLSAPSILPFFFYSSGGFEGGRKGHAQNLHDMLHLRVKWKLTARSWSGWGDVQSTEGERPEKCARFVEVRRVS